MMIRFAGRAQDTSWYTINPCIDIIYGKIRIAKRKEEIEMNNVQNSSILNAGRFI